MSEQKEQGLVERFDMTGEIDGDLAYVLHDPHPYGDWVRYTDHAFALKAQAAENAELRAEVEQTNLCWEQTSLQLAAALRRATAAETALATAREALRANFCPRPCNHRPADFEVGPCVDAGECGCMNVRALKTKEPSHG